MSTYNYKDFLPENFDPSAKVWVYQSSRLFAMGEALQIEDLLETFVSNWKSHGTPVKGYANLFYGRFIIFIADETATGVSGCSTDSSVHLVKEIEQLYKVNLLDRQHLAFMVKDKIETIPLQQFAYAMENNFISPETIYFNNTVLALADLKTNWQIPVQDSWLKVKMATAK
jgi:hypothetical protein